MSSDPAPDGDPPGNVEGCSLPAELLYDLELDVWARLEDDGRELLFGLMATLASFAGKFLTLRFRPVEGRMERGRSVATAESLRFTGAIRIPETGTLVARNERLRDRPKLLNDDPYGRGWVARLARLEPGAPLPPTLRTADEVREEVRAKVREMRIRCYPAIPDVEVIEVGSECSAVLARLDEELALRAPEDVVLLVADDPTTPIEMERWRLRRGHTLLDRRQEGRLFHFLIRKEAEPTPSLRGESGTIGDPS